MSGELKHRKTTYPFRENPKNIKKSEKEEPEGKVLRPKVPPSYGVFKKM